MDRFKKKYLKQCYTDVSNKIEEIKNKYITEARAYAKTVLGHDGLNRAIQRAIDRYFIPENTDYLDELILSIDFYKGKYDEVINYINEYKIFYDKGNAEIEKKYGKFYDENYDFSEHPFIIFTTYDTEYGLDIIEMKRCIVYSKYEEGNQLSFLDDKQYERNIKKIYQYRMRPMTTEEIKSYVVKNEVDVKKTEDLIRNYKNSKFLKKND